MARTRSKSWIIVSKVVQVIHAWLRLGSNCRASERLTKQATRPCTTLTSRNFWYSILARSKSLNDISISMYCEKMRALGHMPIAAPITFRAAMRSCRRISNVAYADQSLANVNDLCGTSLIAAL